MEIIAWIVVAAVLSWAVFIFNRLVRLRNQTATAWSDIDVQLTLRHDLLPQLVKTVKAYASHERQLLESVTELRSTAIQTDQPELLAGVEDRLEKTVGRLLLLSEAYPDLKADKNFAQLQDELVAIEDHLVYARRYYNGAVRDLNTSIEQFPDMLIARLFRFVQAQFYQAEQEHRPAVQAELRDRS